MLVARAEPIGITVRFEDPATAELPADVFGVYVQSPDDHGALLDIAPIAGRAHAAGVLLAVGTDLLSLALFARQASTAPTSSSGARSGSGCRSGMADRTRRFLRRASAYVRQTPGRLIGVSVDSRGRRAYRMALQTREQHIRREKATSNICTAQALLANMAAFYGVYHGPDGLGRIAARVHDQTARLARSLEAGGWRQVNPVYFDTMRLEGRRPARPREVRRAAERADSTSGTRPRA